MGAPAMNAEALQSYECSSLAEPTVEALQSQRRPAPQAIVFGGC